MAPHQNAIAALLVAAGSCLLAACTGSISPTALGMMTTGKLPELPKIDYEPDPVVGSPIEVYSSVARGAMTCWFGAKGPLKGRYIYHADTEPPSKGSRADIVIHALDPAAPSPRGLRTFRVSMKTENEKTTLAVENLKMPEPLATRMKDDVKRWAAGEAGCGEVDAKGQWAPKDAVAEAASAKEKKKKAGK